MPESLILTTAILVPNGPKISINQTLTLDAYDKVDIVIAAGAAGKVVELLPSTASGRVLFLMVVSTWYGEKLSYKVNTPTGTSFTLDQPHLLMGKGALAMLDIAAPEELLFDNTDTKDATVQILIGRDATP